MNLDTLIRAVQRKLQINDDGQPGVQTWTAIHCAICGEQGSAEDQMTTAIIETVDPRSEKNIATLHPRVRPYARALLLQARQRGWQFKFTSALRTYAEQDALYRQGRSAPGKIVTRARAGYSNHNFGLAFDVTLFNGAVPVWDSPLYKALGVLGGQLGLEWGGHWTSLKDEPHYQLRPDWAAGMSETVILAELRRRKASGRDFFA